MRAGYAKSTALAQGKRLLEHVGIARAISEGRAKMAVRANIDQDWVMQNLIECSQRCLQKTPVTEWDHERREFVPATDSEGRTVYQFDSKGANRAWELLGKQLGMFLTGALGSAGNPLVVQAASPRELPLEELERRVRARHAEIEVIDTQCLPAPEPIEEAK
jgi:hypothetical protein